MQYYKVKLYRSTEHTTELDILASSEREAKSKAFDLYYTDQIEDSKWIPNGDGLADYDVWVAHVHTID